MSTTQHPLSDEQTFALAHEHPLIPDFARAAFDAGREHECTATTEPHHDPRPWQDCTRADIREGDLVEALSGDIWRIGVAHHQDEHGDWWTEGGYPLTYGDHLPLRRIPAHTTEKETPMPETTTPAEPLARTLLAVPEGHGAPHHDAGRIKPDDFVMQVDRDGIIRAGRVHHQDEDGDWRAAGGLVITSAAIRADRPDALTVWPAPTPPAVEVEMPTEHPAHITDVEVLDGGFIPHAAIDMGDEWCGVDDEGECRMLPAALIAAFTLPDGTRARRDGTRANGEPRFVKADQ